MGDGIGGAVIGILTNNAFELLVSHTRKDNQDDYGKTEKIIIGKIDDPNEPQYEEKTKEDLERALKGKFVSCNVQYQKRIHLFVMFLFKNLLRDSRI